VNEKAITLFRTRNAVIFVYDQLLFSKKMCRFWRIIHYFIIIFNKHLQYKGRGGREEVEEERAREENRVKCEEGGGKRTERRLRSLKRREERRKSREEGREKREDVEEEARGMEAWRRETG